VFQCTFLIKIDTKRRKERRVEEWETRTEKKERKLSKIRMKI
jgi:hypothetical protein